METFYGIIGAIAYLAIAVGIAAILVGGVIEMVKRLHERMTYLAYRSARKQVGDMIGRDAYWLSESPEAYEIMRQLSNAIHEHSDGIYSIDSVRDAWREKCQK